MLKKITPLFFVMLCGAFVFGLAQLFTLRFQAGDVYPPYSSLRVDPLGAKACYESLANLIATSRNDRPWSKSPDARDAIIFQLGVNPGDSWSEREMKDMELLVVGGSRLVIAYLPVSEKPKVKKPDEDDKKDEKEKSDKNEEPKTLDAGEIAQSWGVTFGYLDLPKQKSSSRLAATSQEAGLEPGISWHSILFFDKLDKAWRVLYRCENKPVVIERNLGSGSIVLCADSYFTSNDSLRRERSPQLLSRLIGNRRRAIFDETIHGVFENPGLASLARKYNLHGLAIALALLAVFFIWKNAQSFVPAYGEGDSGDEVVTGKDSAAGFVNLLRRSIPPQEILRVCVSEWRKSFAHRAGNLKTKLDRIEAVVASEESLPAKQRNAVKSYRTISEILAEKK